jgi:hypothetical protein
MHMPSGKFQRQIIDGDERTKLLGDGADAEHANDAMAFCSPGEGLLRFDSAGCEASVISGGP